MSQNNFYDQSMVVNKTVKQVETEVKVSVKNMNVDLSKLDLSTAAASFEEFSKIIDKADFSKFIDNLTLLQECFDTLQKKISSAKGAVTRFNDSTAEIGGGVIATNIEIDTSGAAQQVSGITDSIGGAAGSIGGMASSIGGAASSIGDAAANVGESFESIGTAISSVIGSAAQFLMAIAAVNQSIVAAATGIAMLIPLLPALGASILGMALNMSGLLLYLPELLIFMGIITILGLMGEGLNLAGLGLLNIGLGLTAMTAGMEALLTFFPLFIECLANTGLNVGGIILFVLLAVAMVAMAVAMQIMNEQFAAFVTSLEKMNTLMSVGFVAAFVVFGLTMIAMSLFMGKVASGIDKITKAISKQIVKLAILNPLLAAQAILSNPIMGVITVALAVAGGLLVRALIPAMATGGVVSSPTMALVGEGRYPEAVVPLGNSPQFSSMKNDIANAVVQAMLAVNGGNRGGYAGSSEIVISLDGERFARAVIPAIERENRRKGYVTQLKSL